MRYGQTLKGAKYIQEWKKREYIKAFVLCSGISNLAGDVNMNMV